VDAANFRSGDRDWAAGNNLAMSVDFLNGAGDAPGIQIRTLRPRDRSGGAFSGAGRIALVIFGSFKKVRPCGATTASGKALDRPK
jgi:hypothetical protein